MTLCRFYQGSELLVISSLCLVHPQLTIWSPKWGSLKPSIYHLLSPLSNIEADEAWWSRRASKDLQLKLIFILLQLGPNYPLPKTNIEIPSLSATSSPGESPPKKFQAQPRWIHEANNGAFSLPCSFRTLPSSVMGTVSSKRSPRRNPRILSACSLWCCSLRLGEKTVVFAKLSTPCVGSLSCNKKYLFAAGLDRWWYRIY